MFRLAGTIKTGRPRKGRPVLAKKLAAFGNKSGALPNPLMPGRTLNAFPNRLPELPGRPGVLPSKVGVLTEAAGLITLPGRWTFGAATAGLTVGTLTVLGGELAELLSAVAELPNTLPNVLSKLPNEFPKLMDGLAVPELLGTPPTAPKTLPKLPKAFSSPLN